MAPALRFSICIVAAITLASSAHAVPPATWSDFFTTVGGSADVDVVGESSTVARPLREHRAEIVNARFFKEKNARAQFTVADRGLAAFQASCVACDGTLVNSDNDRTRAFVDRVSGHLTRPSGLKHQWRARGAICEDREGVLLAGYLAILQDNSAVVEEGDPGSRLIGSLFGMRTPTAIYLFKPDRLQSRAASTTAQPAEDRTAIVEAQMAAEREQIEAFQRKLAIGDETNCGAVIDIRGPMAEIAVPTNVRAPNGAATFWTRIERLAPPGFGLCTYGL